MAQIEKPNVPIYGYHANERSILEQRLCGITYPIYHSTAKKIEKRMYRNHRLVLGNPWSDIRNNKYVRHMAGTYGFNILKVVIESVFAMRGFRVMAVSLGSRYLHTGKDIDLCVTFADPDIESFQKRVKLPVLETPVWHPRRFSVGCWSFIESHKGDCYRTAFHTVDEVNRHIRHQLPGYRLGRLYGLPGLCINPTDHARQMAGIHRIQ